MKIVVFDTEPHEASATEYVISFSRRRSCRKSYPVRN